jgi:hypothetical protein
MPVWALIIVIALVALAWILPVVITFREASRSLRYEPCGEYNARERMRQRENTEPSMFRPRAQARFWASQLPEERRNRLRVTRRPYPEDFDRERGRRYHYY